MLHHVSVGVADVERAAKFYDAVLGALGYNRVMEFLPYAVAYGDDNPSFWLGLPYNQETPSAGNGVHISFMAPSREAIEAFYSAAIELGATDEGAPGARPDYGPEYFGAFVRDPDGNKIEATLHAHPKPARAKRAAGRKKAKKAAKPGAKRKVKAASRKTARAKPAKRAAKKAGRKAKRK